MQAGSKAHVMVFMGGVSSEHDVSRRSGANVVAALDRTLFEVTPVLIERNGSWRFAEESASLSFGDAIARLCATHVDGIFLALHGPFGEDGRLQGLLDLLAIPYTGSGNAASAMAIDKVRSKALIRSAGIPVARQRVITSAEWSHDKAGAWAAVEEELGLPCVMKSPCQGSSLGMAIPATREAFERGMNELLALGDQVLVEEYLRGTEVTCAVLDTDLGQPPRALPVTEIRPVSAAFFDYEAKYTPGATEEITPAPLDERITTTIQDTAVRIHEIIGCTGFSRSDFILVDDDPVWLEVNTIPGLTETSLFPQAAAAAGIGFSDLLTRLLRRAISGGRPASTARS